MMNDKKEITKLIYDELKEGGKSTHLFFKES